MGDVFISYKQDEREAMRPIADGLRALGVDVWFDERLQPDRSFTEEIHHIMSGCKAQVVCWSPAAMASEWVRGEAEVARQRGVLVAVMMQPCSLLPPFNMHHAENLVGWTGDPRHAGWRKVCDAIGRKLDRLGLGELAALQGSADAAAWKRWAQKFPEDPLADTAWTKAEELEVSGARERMARDREATRRAAEEAQRKRAAQPAPPPLQAPPATYAAPPPPAAPAPRGKLGLMLGVGAAALAIAAAAFFIAPQWIDRSGAADVVQAELSTTASGAPASSLEPTPAATTQMPPADASTRPAAAPGQTQTAERASTPRPSQTQIDAAARRLSDALGAAHYLLTLCYDSSDQRWRNTMSPPGAPEGRSQNLGLDNASFNAGYLRQQAAHPTCTATSREEYEAELRAITGGAQALRGLYTFDGASADERLRAYWLGGLAAGAHDARRM